MRNLLLKSRFLYSTIPLFQVRGRHEGLERILLFSVSCRISETFNQTFFGLAILAPQWTLEFPFPYRTRKRDLRQESEKGVSGWTPMNDHDLQDKIRGTRDAGCEITARNSKT
jgi:hypothetical protein